MAIKKTDARDRRHTRVRKSVKGSVARPRLCVFKTSSHIYAQVVDDSKGVTLAAASSVGKDFEGFDGHRGNVKAAARLGEVIGRKALAKGIKDVVFDRGGYKYHGRVKAVAEAARKAGLQF